MTIKNTRFVLRVDTELVDEKYGFSKHRLASWDKVSVQNKTNINDLQIQDNKKKYFSFLDESKTEHLCTVASPTDGCHCFWCRHPFSNRGIGCPIQFIPHKLVKTYHSEITKDKYILRENVNDDDLVKNKEHYHTNRLELNERGYYVMDGLFCSMNCCLAFIRDNTHNPIYSMSEMMLHQLFTELFGNECEPLLPAPHWRLLGAFGGDLSIEDFRASFYKIRFDDMDTILYVDSHTKTVGFLYEKHIRL
jgi:hypothetical protein